MSRKKKPIPKEEVVKVPSSEVVTFTVFFHDCLAKGMVKSWQENELRAFCRDLGLTDKEPADRYLDLLSRF